MMPCSFLLVASGDAAVRPFQVLGVALAVAADDGEDEAFDGDFHGATGTAAGGGGCGAVAGVTRSLLLSPRLGFAAATAAVPLLAVHGFPRVWSDQVLPSL